MPGQAFDLYPNSYRGQCQSQGPKVASLSITGRFDRPYRGKDEDGYRLKEGGNRDRLEVEAVGLEEGYCFWCCPS